MIKDRIRAQTSVRHVPAKVIKILDFGAVVEYQEAPGNEVLLHISELDWKKTEKVTLGTQLFDNKKTIRKKIQIQFQDL